MDGFVCCGDSQLSEMDYGITAIEKQVGVAPIYGDLNSGSLVGEGAEIDVVLCE